MALAGSEGVVDAPLSKAAKINSLVASQAERWIFHHPSDDPLAGLALSARTGLVYETVDLVEGGEVVGELHGLARRALR